jgi:DNA invertase Pin-like site-specific DNA recombinase
LTKGYYDTIILYQNNYSLIDTNKGATMGDYYSYKRISTNTEHQNFNRQIKSLERYAAEHNIEYLLEFTEEKSAKSFDDRPQFKKLDKLLHAGDAVVFKDLSRFTREAENGYKKYMEWLARDINIIFIDNPTISSDYIKQMTAIAQNQDIVTKTAMESVIKLLLMVELDRAEQQRRYISKAITDGIAASNKKSGRKTGQLDKMTDELKNDILNYLRNRHITQNELIKKYNISRNTLKKYIKVIESKQN